MCPNGKRSPGFNLGRLKNRRKGKKIALHSQKGKKIALGNVFHLFKFLSEWEIMLVFRIRATCFSRRLGLCLINLESWRLVVATEPGFSV